jgi:hypothetical protein
MHKTDILDYTFCVHTVSVHCPNTFIYATGRHMLEFYWNLEEIRYFRVSVEMFYSAEFMNGFYYSAFRAEFTRSGRHFLTTLWISADRQFWSLLEFVYFKESPILSATQVVLSL